MYAPAGVHVDAEYVSEGKEEEDSTGEQPFGYPMGIGGVMMNGCYGTNYQIGDPCYDFKTASPNCHVSKLQRIDAKLLEMITRFQNLLEHLKISFQVYKTLGIIKPDFHF